MIDIAVEVKCLRVGMNRKKVQKAIPSLQTYLEEWCKSMTANPTRDDMIGDRLLEKPIRKRFGELEIELRRYFYPNKQKAKFVVIPDPGLDHCVRKALNDKVRGKAETYQFYREGGWKTMLVMELRDFQLASLFDVAASFRRTCPQTDLSVLDYVVLLDHTLGDPMECCWAYKDGCVRTCDEQHREICDCFDR